MINRRKFIHKGLLGSASFLVDKKALAALRESAMPIVVSTWSSNVKANNEAWLVLEKGGRGLDAVEKGVKITEADPNDTSVGYGGLPDRDGFVTLDACVMDEFGNCGSVMAIEEIMHPVSVARRVMERTKHVQLVGNGALQFALEQGFKRQNLLTPASEKAWKQWLKTSGYDPTKKQKTGMKIKNEKIINHDTIGMISLDAKQNLCGACSTSGLSYKMHGRVGDSPIIGAGLFVDNEVGAATATGIGEEVVKICGAHTVIELMRQGQSPEEACKNAIERIVKRHASDAKEIQVGFIALNKKGEYGGYSVTGGFDYVVTTKDGSKVIKAKSFL
jgi:N4-(beta-N-acetylglucosaminyl)-L-asparaginase